MQTLSERLPNALLSGSHSLLLLLLLSRGTKPINNLAFRNRPIVLHRSSQDKISNTHMTAGYHLELWLFSEESALKMVQNAPVKCTLQPVRMNTEAERHIIIWPDCRETLGDQQGGMSLVTSTGLKRASQIIPSHPDCPFSLSAPLLHFRDYK